MSGAEPLDRPRMVALLEALNDALPDGLDVRPAVAVVGGSFLTLHGLRDATYDVDSVERLSAPVRTAVEFVAQAQGLEPDWLNDRAAGFFPQGYPAGAEVLFDFSKLLVVGPHPDAVFLMKVYAGGPDRLHDYDDLVLLWPRCSFASATDATRAYIEAYPHAPTDPYIESYIAEVIAAAT